MKYLKKASAFLLAVLMVLSIATVPTYASTRAPWPWASRISGFKTINITTENAEPGYTKVLQMFMSDYSPIFKEDIDMYGGIDGFFGNALERCVVEFQSVEGITEYRNGVALSPGTASTNTWFAVGDLSYDKEPGNGYIVFGDNFRSTLTSPYIFEYANAVGTPPWGDTEWIEFHRTYS